MLILLIVLLHNLLQHFNILSVACLQLKSGKLYQKVNNFSFCSPLLQTSRSDEETLIILLSLFLVIVILAANIEQTSETSEL